MNTGISQTNILINKGAALFSDGNVDSAISFFKKAVKINPRSTEANFNLGLCYLKNYKINKAVTAFENVLKVDPHDFESLNNLGNIYLGREKIKKAISYYQKAVSINPKLYEGFYNLGVCCQKQNDNVKAIEYYLTSLKLFPQNEKVLNNLAVAYKRVGQTDKAIEVFEKALSIDPNLTMTLSNMGSILLFKDPRRALARLLEAVKKSPDDVGVLYNLGIAYQILGDFDKSLEYLKKCAKADPDFEQVYGQLFLKVRAIADWSGAKRILAKMEKMTQKALKEGRMLNPNR